MTGGLTQLPICPFPPLPWWCAAVDGNVGLDGVENYPKRTFRNRYWIMQSTGPVHVTVPVERRGGRPRPQDQTMRILGEPNRKAWQALKSAYGRAPYFEEMSGELESIFLSGADGLGEWNRSTIAWAAGWLGLAVPLDVSPHEHVIQDHRQAMSTWTRATEEMGIRWSHVWQDRQQDIPYAQLGILDVLLHLGPEAATCIKPIPRNESRRLE